MLIVGGFLVLSLISVTSSSWRDRMSDYKDHPCIRACVADDTRTCEYTFTLEYYYTLTKACYGCPFNQSDCFRPHCVPADGGRKGILTANRMLPGPPIHVCEGDTIIVNVQNMMEGGEGTTIHWHGVLQEDSPHMDGVAMVTQCPIPMHSSFQYKFKAKNPGTHFWHAHQGLQRVDGLFGALVIRQVPTREAHWELYDHDLPEHTITVQDWLDDISMSKFAAHQHAFGSHAATSILINGHGSSQAVSEQSQLHDMHMMDHMQHDMHRRHVLSTPRQTDTAQNTSGHTGHSTHQSNETKPECDCQDKETPEKTSFTPHASFHVQSGQRYRFRLISNGVLNCPIEISVDNHTLIMMASDGKPFHPIEVDSFNIFAGERYDFILSANQNVGNYLFRTRGLGVCGVNGGKLNEKAVIKYKGASDALLSTSEDFQSSERSGKKLNPASEESIKNTVPVTSLTSIQQFEETLKFQQAKVFYLGLDFEMTENVRFHDPDLYSIAAMRHRGHHGHHLRSPQINRITCTMPHSPLLTQYEDISEEMFCNEDTTRKNCSHEFCRCVHILKVSFGDLVEFVIVDEGKGDMDNHPMHLHGHSFAVIAMEKLGESTTVNYVKRLDRAGKIKRKFDYPVIKDTVTIPDGGYTIIRFTANNPGFWLFHCHLAFHMEMGMGLILQVGNPADMLRPPRDFPRCGDWRDQSNKNKRDTLVLDSSSTALQEKSMLFLMAFLGFLNNISRFY